MAVDTHALPAELVDRIRAIHDVLPEGHNGLLAVSIGTEDPDVLERLHSEYGGHFSSGEYVSWWGEGFSFQVSYVGGGDDA